jgi:hypothetical protein
MFVHPGATKAMMLTLNRQGGMPMQRAAELAPIIIDALAKMRVAVIPTALLNTAIRDGADPFELLASMAEEIEDTFGRKPWLPE